MVGGRWLGVNGKRVERLMRSAGLSGLVPNPITVKDPSGTVTTTTYDALDGPPVKRPDDSTVSFGYDAASQRTPDTDALNHATTFSHQGRALVVPRPPRGRGRAAACRPDHRP
jgi:YD repeat-containing protein